MVRGGLALPRGAVLATLASLVDELHGSIHRLYRACVDSLCVCAYLPPAFASDCYHAISRLCDFIAIDLSLFG